VDNDCLVLQLDNPLPPEGMPRKNGNRLALNNIRERLEAHYGKRAALAIEERGGLYRATLSLPLELQA
jgi:two-component system sensor histidine kinase AlgZ